MCKKVLCLMTLVLLLGLVSNASAALDAHWKLDDGVGTTATDSSPTPTHDGTLINGPVWSTNGAPGGLNPTGALLFDGTNDYVDVNGYQGILGSGPMTVAAWVNLPSSEATTQYNHVITWGTDAGWNVGRMFLTINFGNPWMGLAGGWVAVKDNANIADGQWHHIAATLPASGKIADWQIYIDGVAQVMDSFNGHKAINFHDGQVQIGGYAEDNNYYKGRIDDVRIYDSQLSRSDIIAIIPEPATVALLGLGGLALLRRRKK